MITLTTRYNVAYICACNFAAGTCSKKKKLCPRHYSSFSFYNLLQTPVYGLVLNSLCLVRHVKGCCIHHHLGSSKAPPHKWSYAFPHWLPHRLGMNDDASHEPEKVRPGSLRQGRKSRNIKRDSQMAKSRPLRPNDRSE